VWSIRRQEISGERENLGDRFVFNTVYEEIEPGAYPVGNVL